MLRYGFSRAVLCVIRVCIIFVMPTHRYPPSFRIGVLDSGHSKAAGGPGTHWVKRGENWAKGTHGNPLGLIKRYMLRVLLVLILNADLRACCDVKAFCFGVLNPHSPWLCWLLKHLLSRGCVCWGWFEKLKRNRILDSLWCVVLGYDHRMNLSICIHTLEKVSWYV